MPFRPLTSGGGIDTSDATATAAQIDEGVTAYIASGKVTGTRKSEYLIDKALALTAPTISVSTAVAAI